MMKLKNTPMQGRILGAFTVVCLMFLFANYLINLQNKNISSLTASVKEEVYPSLINYLHIQADILQIQQWLTDISATRAAAGYDDGYAEAEKFYQDAVKRIDSARRDLQQAGNSEMVRTMSSLRESLDAYYAMGKKLAAAYIKGGPESGNKLMDQFDQFAEKLTVIVDDLVEGSEAVLADQLERILSGEEKSSEMLMIFSAVALFLATCVSFFLTRSITTPLSELVSYAHKMKNGDLTAQSTLEQDDEIGKLAVSLNEMGSNLRGMFQDILSATRTLTESSKELASISTELSGNAEHTTAKANSVAVAAEEMSANMTSVAAATEQTSVNVNMVASAAEEMTSTIAEISSNTEQTQTITTTAVTQSANATSQIKELGAAAKEIGKVTEAITEISEQTNLLALNATIEAARAGEAGKGFAVVANEIKDLAKQTSDATAQIKEKIEAIQHASRGSVTEITQISEIINAIDEKISMVAQTVLEQTNATQEIAENVSQASHGIQEVNENVAQASAVTGEIASDITMVGQASNEINESSSQVSSSAVGLEELSEKLSAIVNKFKV